MKKLLALLLVGIMAISFVACGSKETKKEVKEEKEEKKVSMTGKWMIDSVEFEGKKYSVDEWETETEEDISDLYVILKDGGEALIYTGDNNATISEWTQSENELTIDGDKFIYKDGILDFEEEGFATYLKKVSDSQETPKEHENIFKEDTDEDFDYDSEDEEDDDDESALKDTDAESSLSESEWRQFLVDYEAFIDKYIELTKKVEANPENPELLEEILELDEEADEWNKKSEEITQKLGESEASIEFAMELLKIVGKMADLDVME